MVEPAWEFVKSNALAVSAVATSTLLVIELLRFLGIHKAVQTLFLKVASTTDEESKDQSPDVDVSYRDRPGKSSNWIVIQNDWRSDEEAEVVSIDVTGDDDPVPSSELDRKLPAVLDAGQEVKLMAAFHKQCGPPHDVEITWEDSQGERHKFEKTIYR